QALGQFLARRHAVRDAGRADLVLRAHDALRERGWRGEKGARDLLRGEPADLAQREGDLRIGGERRMAAGEDQPQPIVLELLAVGVRAGLGRVLELARELGERRIEARTAADLVDRLEAAGG